MQEEQPQQKSRKGYNRILKIVRRIHMYTGLILLPWVILFGFSGMLFNHAEWFGPVEVVLTQSADEVAQFTNFEKPDANRIADSVISQLNENVDLSNLKWEKASAAVMEGKLGFSGTSDKGRTLVQLSPNRGSADVRYFIESPKQDHPDFHGKKLTVPSFDAENATSVAENLLAESGLITNGSLEAVERGGAEVQFQVRSNDDDRLWNVTYSLMNQTVSARAEDSPSGLNFYSAVTRLHKTHHYPDRKGARWLWTAFADATGITMVFWGISGLIMWWQIKPTRVLGFGGLGLAAALAVLIFTGTFKTLTFGPVSTRSGPGKSTPSAKGAPSDSAPRKPQKVEGTPNSETSIETGPVDGALKEN